MWKTIFPKMEERADGLGVIQAALDLRGCLKATCLLFKDSPSLDKQIPSEPATGLPGTISVSAFSMHQTAETATWGSMTE